MIKIESVKSDVSVLAVESFEVAAEPILIFSYNAFLANDDNSTVEKADLKKKDFAEHSEALRLCKPLPSYCKDYSSHLSKLNDFNASVLSNKIRGSSPGSAIIFMC